MRLRNPVVLGAAILAMALAGCGEQTTGVVQDGDSQDVNQPQENVILRGDVGDFVWFDQNNNGLQDDGTSSGVNGVDVIIECIRTLDGSLWTMTFTTANSPVTGLSGWYNFNSVPAGSCMAYVDPATVPSHLVISSLACGGPLDFVIGEGPTGNNNKNIDFCLVLSSPPGTGAIGDFIWCDLDNDGIQDPGEPGVEGVVVNLVCSGGHSATQMTDVNGLYLFTGVPVGVVCTVSVDPASFPPDKEPGTNCPTVHTVTIAEGETNLDQDFCLIDMPPFPPEGEGCTPGYWKNHTDSWGPSGYAPGDLVGGVFDLSGYSMLASDTLLEALQYKGGNGLDGAARILLRAATAALLNASHPDVDSPWEVSDLLLAVDNALATDDRSAILQMAWVLDMDNNLGCPLN